MLFALLAAGTLGPQTFPPSFVSTPNLAKGSVIIVTKNKYRKEELNELYHDA
jgi:predicted small lipoprotein YifL